MPENVGSPGAETRLKVSLAFYETARAEIVQRLRLRDTVLLLYLGAVAAILAAAYGEDFWRSGLLLVVPILSLGATVLAMHHNAIIGALASYCVVDVGDYLRTLVDSPECPPHWDKSTSFQELETSRTRFHPSTHGQGLLLVIPQAAAFYVYVAVAFQADGFPDTPNGVASWSGWAKWIGIAVFVACLALTFAVLFIVSRDRRRKRFDMNRRRISPLLRGCGPVRQIGHKGAAKVMPPGNTLASLDCAVELGLDFVEFDVVATKDGEVVLAHSDDLREQSNGTLKGSARAHTLMELRRLLSQQTILGGGQRVQLATVDEALNLLSQKPDVRILVDLKSDGVAPHLVTALRRYDMSERTLICSTETDWLVAVREIAPDLALSMSHPKDRAGIDTKPRLRPLRAALLTTLRWVLRYSIEAKLARTCAEVVTLHHNVVSKATVQRCHARKVAVLAWTVNDPADFVRVERAGVDGVITDDPRIFKPRMGPEDATSATSS